MDWDFCGKFATHYAEVWLGPQFYAQLFKLAAYPTLFVVASIVLAIFGLYIMSKITKVCYVVLEWVMCRVLSFLGVALPVIFGMFAWKMMEPYVDQYMNQTT
jgi:L-cystine uptake protein TcyP (sodium:dicarboxylate symporter family)